MSFSLIVREFKRLLVLYLNFGNAPAFWTGVHWAAKWELKSSVFILKSDTSLPSARIGGMAGIFFCSKSNYDGPICFWSCIGVI